MIANRKKIHIFLYYAYKFFDNGFKKIWNYEMDISFLINELIPCIMIGDQYCLAISFKASIK